MMVDPKDAVITLAGCLEEAQRNLKLAAEILRGDGVPASPRAMRAEQQVTRALDALWNIGLP